MLSIKPWNHGMVWAGWALRMSQAHRATGRDPLSQVPRNHPRLWNVEKSGFSLRFCAHSWIPFPRLLCVRGAAPQTFPVTPAEFHGLFSHLQLLPSAAAKAAQAWKGKPGIKTQENPGLSLENCCKNVISWLWGRIAKPGMLQMGRIPSKRC